jgi:hypothetical protein
VEAALWGIEMSVLDDISQDMHEKSQSIRIRMTVFGGLAWLRVAAM